MDESRSLPGDDVGGPVMTRLLVSVRDADEAHHAVEGGADIIDVKEPRRGPLGAASPDVIRDVVMTVRDRNPAIPVSAALGETADWLKSADGMLPAERFGNALSPQVPDFLKLGTAGLCRNGSDTAWIDAWQAVRESLDSRLPRDVGWVAVAYADFQSCDAPAPEAVLHAAVQSGCRGLLIDTFTKKTGGLLSFTDVETLTELCAAARRSGLWSALAGQIQTAHLTDVLAARPDIVAVRSAVCPQGRREASISDAAVRHFRTHLRQAPQVTQGR